jgi:Protein of unknown function (DUF2815)
VRCAWPSLFVARQYNGTGSWRCGAQLIIQKDHPQAQELKDMIQAAATAKWKDKAPARLKAAMSKDKVCLRDGDLAGHLDCWVVSANCAGGETQASAKRPSVFDAANRNILQIAKEVEGPHTQSKPELYEYAQEICPVYAGCYVNAVIDIYAMDQYGDQINAGLVGVQFARDGESFGGAAGLEAGAFEPLEVPVSGVDDMFG